jgi:hypothetical protein
MICSHPDCPAERAARIMDELIREGEKRGSKFRAEMTHAHSCELCGKTKKWTRVDEGDQRLISEEARQH